MASSSPPSLPQVLAMIICDTVIDDRISNKKSLIGLFDAIATTHLPCVVNELHVFLALTEGYGAMQLKLRCAAAESDNELFATESQISFPNPLAVLEINLGFRGCSFPRVGEYRFQLFADGTPLCERKFRITRVSNPPPQPENGDGGDDDESDASD
jgi:hypothetical protein